MVNHIYYTRMFYCAFFVNTLRLGTNDREE